MLPPPSEPNSTKQHQLAQRQPLPLSPMAPRQPPQQPELELEPELEPQPHPQPHPQPEPELELEPEPPLLTESILMLPGKSPPKETRVVVTLITEITEMKKKI